MRKLQVVLSILCLTLIIGFFMEEPVQTTKIDHKKQVTIGVLQTVSHPALDDIYRGMQDQLKKRGYQQDKNLKIIFQNAQGDQSNLKSMSEQILQKKPDVTVGIATPAAQSLANATIDIPIVLGAVTDPKGASLVANNQKPGGNITGISDQAPIQAQFELIKKIMPKIKKIGILYSANDDSAMAQVKIAEAAAKKEHLNFKTYSITNLNDLEQVAQTMASEVEAVYVPTDNQIASSMPLLLKYTDEQKIPVFPAVDTMVKDGGLASVSINQYQLGTETGNLVADLLSGKKQTATTPVKFIKKGDLVINQQKAKQLGIKIPDELLAKSKIVGGD